MQSKNGSVALYDATRKAVEGIVDFNFHKPLLAGRPPTDDPDPAYDNMRRVHRQRANRQLRVGKNPYNCVNRNEYNRWQSARDPEDDLREIDTHLNVLATGSTAPPPQIDPALLPITSRPHAAPQPRATADVSLQPDQQPDQLYLSHLRRAREAEARARWEWEQHEARIQKEEAMEHRAREETAAQQQRVVREQEAERLRVEQEQLRAAHQLAEQQKRVAEQQEAERMRLEQLELRRRQQEEADALLQRRLMEEQERRRQQEEEERIRAGQEEEARQRREQELLQQQQQQQQQAASGGAVGSTASPAPATASTTGSGKTYLEEANELIAQAEQCYATVQQFLQDPNMKPRRLEVQKKLNMRVFQISAMKRTIELGAIEICEVISRLKEGGSQQAQLYNFALWKSVDLLADTSLNIQANSDATAAWPVAHVCARVFNAHPDAFTLFKGLMYQRCRYLIPSYEENIDEKEEDNAFRRTVGYERLWLALIVLRKDYSLMWGWWARILNEEVRRITPSLIVAALEITGHSMQQRFGKNWKKLVAVIQSNFLPQAEKLRQIRPALISAVIPRVTKWLEVYGNGRQIPQPPGKDIQTNKEQELRSDI